MALFKRIFGKRSKEQDEKFEQDIQKIESGEYNKIYPILKPGDWVGIKAGALRQTLIGDQENPDVVIAYGYDTPNNFIFLTYDDAEKRPVEETLNEAYTNLSNVPSRFEPVTALDGAILTASGLDFSSEKILDAEFMLEAHQILKAEELLVSIPRRRCMMVTSQAAPDKIINAFFHFHNDAWNDDSYGNAPITNMIFVVKNGVIEGVISIERQ